MDKTMSGVVVFGMIVKLVIFDMDGTVFDTERLGIEKWVEAAKKLGFPLPENALYEKIGLSSKDSKKFLQEACGAGFDYDTVKSLKKQMVNDHVAKNGTPIKEGFHELIEFLKKQKILTALATSRTRGNTEHYIKHAGKEIDKKFNLIVTGDMIEKGKPNPDIFLSVIKQLDIPAENALVIEDAPNGIKAANAARIRAVMIPDSVQPNNEIKNLAFSVKRNLHEVIDVICEINGIKKNHYCKDNFSCDK